MNSFRVPGKKFFCNPAADAVEGPFELIELAGLLRGQHISAQTPTLIEGEDQWLPFQDRPEFLFAKEIPQTAVLQHLQEKQAEQESSFSPRKLLLFAWIMAPLLLYVLYRVLRMYLVYYLAHHGSAAPDSVDAAGGS